MTALWGPAVDAEIAYRQAGIREAYPRSERPHRRPRRRMAPVRRVAAVGAVAAAGAAAGMMTASGRR